MPASLIMRPGNLGQPADDNSLKSRCTGLLVMSAYRSFGVCVPVQTSLSRLCDVQAMLPVAAIMHSAWAAQAH